MKAKTQRLAKALRVLRKLRRKGWNTPDGFLATFDRSELDDAIAALEAECPECPPPGNDPPPPPPPDDPPGDG